jgi:TonB family protein
MEDRVGEVLARRAALESGAAAGVALSVFLHVAAAAFVIYAAMHHPTAQSVDVITINLAPMTGGQAPAPVRTPVIHEPKPVVEQTQKPVAKPEPKTVPLSVFGKSTKKGSEVPVAAPIPAVRAGGGAGAPLSTEVPVGGTGVAIEGDFPYTIYIDNMRRLIGQHWFRPQVTPGTATTIHFAIDRDGSIRDINIETPSGNGTFDRAAQRAILESSPLPPLPFAYNGTFLGVHLTFK